MAMKSKSFTVTNPNPILSSNICFLEGEALSATSAVLETGCGTYTWRAHDSSTHYYKETIQSTLDLAIDTNILCEISYIYLSDYERKVKLQQQAKENDEAGDGTTGSLNWSEQDFLEGNVAVLKGSTDKDSLPARGKIHNHCSCWLWSSSYTKKGKWQ